MRSRDHLAALALALLAVLMGASSAIAAPVNAQPPQARVSTGCVGPDFICAAGSVVANAPGLVPQVVGATAEAGLGSLAGSAFGAIAQQFGEAGVAFLGSLADAFVESSTIELSRTGIDPIIAIATPLAMLVAVLLIVVAAGKAAVTGQGSVIAATLVGIVKAVLVTALVVTVVQTALYASDAVTEWIINQSLGGSDQLERRIGSLITIGALSGSAALVLLFGLIAIVIGLVLWVELLFRSVAIVVLVAMSPIAAAGQVLDSTSEWWHKARNALIQLILLKPVIALCFAVGFSTFGSAKDLTGVIAGFVTLGLAGFAWPLLARFMTFTSSGSSHSGVAALMGGAAGTLMARRGGAPSSGPPSMAGSGYTLALESQNDAGVAATAPVTGGRLGGLSTGRMVGGLTRAGSSAVTAVGVAAAVGSSVINHVESQMTGASADAGLGHASPPRQGYARTRRPLGSQPSRPTTSKAGATPPTYAPAMTAEPVSAPSATDTSTQEGTQP